MEELNNEELKGVEGGACLGQYNLGTNIERVNKDTIIFTVLTNPNLVGRFVVKSMKFGKYIDNCNEPVQLLKKTEIPAPLFSELQNQIAANAGNIAATIKLIAPNKIRIVRKMACEYMDIQVNYFVEMGGGVKKSLSKIIRIRF